MVGIYAGSGAWSGWGDARGLRECVGRGADVGNLGMCVDYAGAARRPLECSGLRRRGRCAADAGGPGRRGSATEFCELDPRARQAGRVRGARLGFVPDWVCSVAWPRRQWDGRHQGMLQERRLSGRGSCRCSCSAEADTAGGPAGESAAGGGRWRGLASGSTGDGDAGASRRAASLLLNFAGAAACAVGPHAAHHGGGLGLRGGGARAVGCGCRRERGG
jgi:hypothetical protein